MKSLIFAPLALMGTFILGGCGSAYDASTTNSRAVEKISPGFVDEAPQKAADPNRQLEVALKDCGGTSKLSSDSDSFGRCFDQHSK